MNVDDQQTREERAVPDGSEETRSLAILCQPCSQDKNSGTLDGQGRTILENGTLISTPLKGTWKRMGANVKFYFTDAINNGAMNFVMWDVNLLKKKADVKYFELHEAEN